MNLVALIPARAGSKRIPNKNLKPLAGHLLIEYTIAAARQSGVFAEIVVCSDSRVTLDLAREMGDDLTLFERNPSYDTEPDIAWVQRVIEELGRDWDAFAILRPSSPFRVAATIHDAAACFKAGGSAYSSLRAIEPAKQHPGKMWTLHSGEITPLLLQPCGTPWHSSPTQTLPKVYIQNASLEIAWVDTVKRTGTIAGDSIMAFETREWEGFDINTIEDWWVAERAIAEGVAQLPKVGTHSWTQKQPERLPSCCLDAVDDA